ncbi:hypothetical protein B0H17DRAFT_1145944 [Mycena rosella]|uniref:Uncharacterized protein n=1 Tax=Mycena rosella TaxID=1033263 RepID=A0AAD7G5C3_MYCRO|nr:hypothetical protein B0H17DRAFT_1145944 [Mycena rosella]
MSKYSECRPVIASSTLNVKLAASSHFDFEHRTEWTHAGMQRGRGSNRESIVAQYGVIHGATSSHRGERNREPQIVYEKEIQMKSDSARCTLVPAATAGDHNEAENRGPRGKTVGILKRSVRGIVNTSVGRIARRPDYETLGLNKHCPGKAHANRFQFGRRRSEARGWDADSEMGHTFHLETCETVRGSIWNRMVEESSALAHDRELVEPGREPVHFCIHLDKMNLAAKQKEFPAQRRLVSPMLQWSRIVRLPAKMARSSHRPQISFLRTAAHGTRIHPEWKGYIKMSADAPRHRSRMETGRRTTHAPTYTDPHGDRGETAQPVFVPHEAYATAAQPTQISTLRRAGPRRLHTEGTRARHSSARPHSAYMHVSRPLARSDGSVSAQRTPAETHACPSLGLGHGGLPPTQGFTPHWLVDTRHTPTHTHGFGRPNDRRQTKCTTPRRALAASTPYTRGYVRVAWTPCVGLSRESRGNKRERDGDGETLPIARVLRHLGRSAAAYAESPDLFFLTKQDLDRRHTSWKASIPEFRSKAGYSEGPDPLSTYSQKP